MGIQFVRIESIPLPNPGRLLPELQTGTPDLRSNVGAIVGVHSAVLYHPTVGVAKDIPVATNVRSGVLEGRVVLRAVTHAVVGLKETFTERAVEDRAQAGRLLALVATVLG